MMTVFETPLGPKCTIYHIYVQPHAHDFGLVYTIITPSLMGSNRFCRRHSRATETTFRFFELTYFVQKWCSRHSRDTDNECKTEGSFEVR